MKRTTTFLLSLVLAIPAAAQQPSSPPAATPDAVDQGGCKALRQKALSTSGADAARLLGEAQTACRESQKALSREQQPVPWAVVTLDLANVTADRAIVAGGDGALQGLDEAIGLYRQALEVLAEGRSPEVLAAAQMNLGSALQSRGIRTAGLAALPLLQESTERLGQALGALSPEKNPQDWAETQNNLGLALAELGARKGKPAGNVHLEQAFQAFGAVQQVYTQEKQLRRWSEARFNQARVLLALEKFEEAAPILQEITAKDLDHRRALIAYVSLLNGKLARPADAMGLTAKYVERHPADFDLQMIHLDNMIAAGRVAETRLRVAALTEKSDGLPAAFRIHLMGYEIATGLATGSKDTPGHLSTLIKLVESQPADFRISGSFTGSLRFLQARPDMRSSDWQTQLFHALQGRNGRDAMLAELRKLQEAMEAAPS